MLPLLVPTLALVVAGCTKGRDPYPNRKLDAAPPIPDAAPPPKDAALPPNMARANPGEPGSQADFNKLSDAAKAGKAVDKPGAPPIKRLDAYRVRVGKVLVDRLAQQITVPGRVNMSEGILEYYAVSSGGKLHEAVIELNAEPSHIHLGLILLGVKQAEWDRSDRMKMPTLTKRGGLLDLYVEWQDPKTGKAQRTRGEDWLYNRRRKASPKALPWFFHGSSFWNGRFTADMDRSVLALIPDDTAILMLDGDEGNPYRGENEGYEVHSKVIPPVDTPLKMILQIKDAVKPDIKGRTLPGSKLPMLAPRPIRKPGMAPKPAAPKAPASK
jgi:hypothetical protein